MPRAVSQNTTVARRVQRAPAPSLPTFVDPATLPDQYGMRMVGDRMSPEIEDKALVWFDKREPVKAGDLVAIYRRPDLVPAGQHQAQVKRLVLNIMAGVTFPHRDHPGPEVLHPQSRSRHGGGRSDKHPEGEGRLAV